jgi:hypothetical protein
MCIFNDDKFTLKDFCRFFIDNVKLLNNKIDKNELSEILFISDIYISFSTGTNYYKKHLNNLRNMKGLLFINNNNNKKIYFREILQIFDIEFTKLVIRIKTEGKDYDINVLWSDFEKNFDINKNDLKKILMN